MNGRPLLRAARISFAGGFSLGGEVVWESAGAIAASAAMTANREAQSHRMKSAHHAHGMIVVVTVLREEKDHVVIFSGGFDEIIEVHGIGIVEIATPAEPLLLHGRYEAVRIIALRPVVEHG